MGNFDVDCVSFLKIDRHIEYAGMLYQGAPNGYGVVIDNLHRNITLGIFAAWELKTAYQNELSELLQKADAFQAATFYETNIFLGEVFCQREKGVRQGYCHHTFALVHRSLSCDRQHETCHREKI